MPLRHIQGVFNGLKAAVETFKSAPADPVPPVNKAEEPVVVVVEEVIVGKAGV